MSWVKFETFKCLNLRLLISRLIAFRVLTNPKLSMGIKKKKKKKRKIGICGAGS
jgi:hypothetical protein